MRLRFPWSRRVEAEQRQRQAAEQRLAHVRAQWPHVHAAVAPLRHERQLNGWTDTIASIFDPSRKDPR